MHIRFFRGNLELRLMEVMDWDWNDSCAGFLTDIIFVKLVYIHDFWDVAPHKCTKLDHSVDPIGLLRTTESVVYKLSFIPKNKPNLPFPIKIFLNVFGVLNWWKI